MAERMPVEPKFRPVCECGTRAPRPVTAYTATKWMNAHVAEHLAQRADGESSPST